jgi:hypothetical protein
MFRPRCRDLNAMSDFRKLCQWWRAFCLGFFVVVTVAACDDSKPQQNYNQAQTEQQLTTNTEQQSPTDIVKAHAPESETKLLGAAQVFHAQRENKSNAPNDLVADEIRKKNDSIWRNAVLRIGHFKQWAAYVRRFNSIDKTIELQLSEPLFLKFQADVPPGGTMGSTIRTLREGQPVYISGRIANDDIEFTKDSTIREDEFAPTCFENGFALVGCKIQLESIVPL